MTDTMMQLVGGGLVTAVLFLFGIVIKERSECMADRLLLWKKIYELSQHNCPSSDCPMRAAPASLNEIGNVAAHRIAELQSKLKVNQKVNPV